jgi:hypothetical protein
MREISDAILALSTACEINGESLYGIEIGEETYNALKLEWASCVKCVGAKIDGADPFNEVFGVKIYIHRKPLKEFATQDLLDEVSRRNAEQLKILKSMT